MGMMSYLLWVMGSGRVNLSALLNQTKSVLGCCYMPSELLNQSECDIVDVFRGFDAHKMHGYWYKCVCDSIEDVHSHTAMLDPQKFTLGFPERKDSSYLVPREVLDTPADKWGAPFSEGVTAFYEYEDDGVFYIHMSPRADEPVSAGFFAMDICSTPAETGFSDEDDSERADDARSRVREQKRARALKYVMAAPDVINWAKFSLQTISRTGSGPWD